MTSEVREQIIQLANNIDVWRQSFEGWELSIRKSYKRYRELEKYKDLILKIDFENTASSLNVEEVSEFMKLVWGDPSFGSVGQGTISQSDILVNRANELYNITRQMIRGLKASNDVPSAFYNSDSIKRNGRDLRAIKLRALSVLSNLLIPSLYYDRHFHKLAAFIDKDVDYPDSSQELLIELANFLPEEHRKDEVLRFMFPWVVYEVLVLKSEGTNGLRSILSNKNAGNKIVGNVPRHWWIKGIETVQWNTRGDQGSLDLDLISDENRRKEFDALRKDEVHYAIFSNRMMMNNELIYVELSYSNNPFFQNEIRYEVLAVFKTQKSIVDFLLEDSAIEESKDLLSEKNAITSLSKAVFEKLISKLFSFEVIPNEDLEESSKIQAILGIKGKNHSQRDKRDVKGVIGVQTIALKLAEQIKVLEEEEGQMIGIFGRWGRGKTFLVRELCKSMSFEYDQEIQENNKSKFHLVKIHAWKYKEVNAFWAYMYESIAKQYYEGSSSNWWKELYRRIKLNKRRLGSLTFYKYLIPLILSLVWWGLSTECKSDIIGLIIGKSDLNLSSTKGLYQLIISLAPVLFSGLLFYKNVLPKATRFFSTFTKKYDFKNELGFQAKVQEELKTLLEVWIPVKKMKRLLIVVDDLDRCDIDNIVPISDALRVILEDTEIIKRTIVLTMVDERILAKAIKNKYRGVVQTAEMKDFVREYMDKLFITGLKLPELLDEEKTKILNSITEGHVLELEKKPIVDELPPDDFDDEESRAGAADKSSKKLNDDPLKSLGQNYTKENRDEPFLVKELMKDNHQITSQEEQLLQKYVKELHSPTPRQIKIFYYRYLLLKFLDDSPEYQIEKSIDSNRFYEYALYLIVRAQKGEKTEYRNGEDIDYGAELILGDNVNEIAVSKLRTLVHMVVPY